MVKFKKKIIIKKALVATVKYDRKVAMRFHDLRYQETEQERIKSYVRREADKERFSTSKKVAVTAIFSQYQEAARATNISVFRNLIKIRDRSIKEVINNGTDKFNKKFDDLLGVVANPYILLAAYRTIRKNKGILTEAYPLPESVFWGLSAQEKAMYYKVYKFPDGLT